MLPRPLDEEAVANRRGEPLASVRKTSTRVTFSLQREEHSIRDRPGGGQRHEGDRTGRQPWARWWPTGFHSPTRSIGSLPRRDIDPEAAGDPLPSPSPCLCRCREFRLWQPTQPGHDLYHGEETDHHRDAARERCRCYRPRQRRQQRCFGTIGWCVGRRNARLLAVFSSSGRCRVQTQGTPRRHVRPRALPGLPPAQRQVQTSPPLPPSTSATSALTAVWPERCSAELNPHWKCGSSTSTHMAVSTATQCTSTSRTTVAIPQPVSPRLSKR